VDRVRPSDQTERNEVEQRRTGARGAELNAEREPDARDDSGEQCGELAVEALDALLLALVPVAHEIVEVAVADRPAGCERLVIDRVQLGV
jgi:hypothetical protein